MVIIRKCIINSGVALTKQESQNICQDADKMVGFFLIRNTNQMPAVKTDLTFFQHPNKCSVLLIF